MSSPAEIEQLLQETFEQHGHGATIVLDTGTSKDSIATVEVVDVDQKEITKERARLSLMASIAKGMGLDKLNTEIADLTASIEKQKERKKQKTEPEKKKKKKKQRKHEEDRCCGGVPSPPRPEKKKRKQEEDPLLRWGVPPRPKKLCKPSAWMVHVQDYRTKNPTKSYKECLTGAKEDYVCQPKKTVPGTVNRWMTHVSAYRKEHPEITNFKDVLKNCKETYSKV